MLRLHLPFMSAMFFCLRWGITKEKHMISRHLTTCSLAALAGAAMLTLSIGSASAFTLASPSLEQPYASAQIEKVWWDHWHHWHGGWGPGPGWHRHCWRNQWGHLRCD